ncbi:mannosylphosphate transferase [Phlyctema vagabunda]|uniref:Mannosylphosphate transferase n=1 Tax=Phlyctema vagabunda TaxID=108571 RepID=A0ABR4PDF2_9HELO
MKFQQILTGVATALLLTPALAAPSPQPEPNNAPPAQVQKRDGERKDTKYFHEPGSNDQLGHYDIRYYTEPVSYDEHRNSLRYLIRAYLTAFRRHNVETWIAHGTLLGWWWNGKIMPWDPDLDTQVSASTLTWLGENLNMTYHNYTGLSPTGETVNRTYLLDINPNSAERVRGDGQNVIDARFIDISNGMFIDITGLSETNPSVQPGIWSCKNYHRYRTRDLYPLRETVFEGVPATVPYSFDKILTEEYSQKALTKTSFEGHRWHPAQKEWIKEPEADKPSSRKRDVESEALSPHIPRSVMGAENPVGGLGNLVRAFA